MARKKYNRLDMVSNGRLCVWITDVAGEDKKFDNTFETLATRASEELGFEVTKSNIASYARGLGITPKVVKRNNPTLVASLTERIEKLESQMSYLLESLGGK